jgi:hypothetical protein
MTRSRLRRLIHAHLQREWVFRPPGDECFDRDETNMERALLFLGGGSDARVRVHLLGCSRCRYLYTVLRKVLVGAKDESGRGDGSGAGPR